MELQALKKVAADFMGGLPDPVTQALTDVEVIVTDTVPTAIAELSEELGDEFDKKDFPADCKGIFVGTPTEIEESEDDDGDEIVYYPEGFIVLCADQIESEHEGVVVIMHEIGHALGMSEEEVTALGLGVEGNGTQALTAAAEAVNAKAEGEKEDKDEGDSTSDE